MNRKGPAEKLAAIINEQLYPCIPWRRYIVSELIIWFFPFVLRSSPNKSNLGKVAYIYKLISALCKCVVRVRGRNFAGSEFRVGKVSLLTLVRARDRWLDPVGEH